MTWIPDSIQTRLVLVLAHFLWQGTLIAALLASGIALLRVRRAKVQYAASLCAFVLMAVSPVVTWFVLPESAARPSVREATQVRPAWPEIVSAPQIEVRDRALMTEAWSPPAMIALGQLVETSPPPVLAHGVEFESKPESIPPPRSGEASLTESVATAGAAWWRWVEPWIVFTWLCGVILFSLRLMIAAVATWRWRAQVEPLPGSLVMLVDQLCGLLGMRVPRVGLSPRVTEAVAMGLFRPLILLPVAWATSLPPDMIEAVLAHELAHIRRYDLWVNLMQRVVETLIFYHPAVWWLSGRLRQERELCCDELAVATTRDDVRYAETLEHIGRMSLASTRHTLAVSMGGPKHALLERVRHVLKLGSPDDSRGGSLAAAMLLILGVLCGSLFYSRTMLAGNDWSSKRVQTSWLGQDRHHAFFVHNGKSVAFIVARLDPPGSDSNSGDIQITGTKRGGLFTHRNFTIRHELTNRSEPPDRVTINGKSFSLCEGRVLVMGDKYTVTQLPIHELEMVTEDNLKSFVQNAVAQMEQKLKGDELPAEVAPAEPKSPIADARPPTFVEAAGHYRGRVVASDGSPLPADLKLFRRVSGEATTETSVSRDGTFSFDAASQSGSVRFAIKSDGYAPFDSDWVKLDSTLTLTLSRGAAITLRMKVADGAGPLSGKVRLIVPWDDDDEQGEFPVDANGIVTIAHCPEKTVDLDVRVPGYEELRIHRLVRGDLTLDVPLIPAQPTRMRIVSVIGLQPIAGAKLRLFSRVRAGSFLTPFRYYGNDEIWGESDANGLVTLTTLRATDPVPTNIPGAASYAFRIDAPNHAPRYLDDVQAGADLGYVAFAEPLEVRGEIAHELNERVSLQVRQPTVAQGGSDGRGDWMTAPTVEVDGKATFHLTNLKPRQFDLFILYSNAAEPQNSLRGTIKQLQFHGMLTGSSSDLKITRESVTPGDKNLTSRRGSLFPIEEDRSNVPNRIVGQFVAQVTTISDAGGTVIAQELKPTLQPLFVWSNTAPVQHSMGYVSWRLFVLQDGTVFIPGDMNREAGTLHKLSAAELQELKDLLEKHREMFGRQVPKELPQFADWRHGHESLLYTKDGVTKTFVNWQGLDEVPIVGEFNPTGSHQAITEYITRLMSDVACGGRKERTRFHELANKALAVVLPKATPFDDADWTNATIQSDGTKTIRFADTKERTEVTLIQPSFGPVYVERVEHQGKGIAFDPKSISGLSATGERSPSRLAPDIQQIRRAKAIERAVQFLKSQQQADGSWPQKGASFKEGSTAMAVVALLQSGLKGDDEAVAKGLDVLRKCEDRVIYIVALQTMAFCAGSPERDAELIRRNVAHIEAAQVTTGQHVGGWSYRKTAEISGADGSCTRFALLGLDAAKRAGFHVQSETWDRAAKYWLSSQQGNGGWGYSVGGLNPTPTMTLAGLAGLATTHRYLPKDDQAVVREAAMKKSLEEIVRTIKSPDKPHQFYYLHALERAGHLTKTERFGDLDWKSVLAERLLTSQHRDGWWKGSNHADSDPIVATSFALMFLSGQPEAAAANNANVPPVLSSRTIESTGERSPSPAALGVGKLVDRNFIEQYGEAFDAGKDTPAKPGQTGHGVVLSVRGHVLIDGAIPDVPPLKVKVGLMLVNPRNDEDERKNAEREKAAVAVEIPDDSLVISKEGGLANVAIYLKKAPANWKPSDPPSEPIELRAADNCFLPRMSLLRVGQSLRLNNMKHEAQDFRSAPIRSNLFHLIVDRDLQRLIDKPFTISETLPTEVKSNIHWWQKAYLLALDHPFAAITDADGRFEIRGLPPGEHHFTVWHERRGYLNKDLVVRVEEGRVAEVELKYPAEQLERRVKP